MANKDYRDAYVAAHISNTVASQIAMLRDREGWSQKQLAQKANMSQSRISALEDPNYENYEVATLKRVASAFDVGLTVRFCAYNEIVNWVTDLSPVQLAVPTFSTDTLTVSSSTSRPLMMAGLTGFILQPTSAGVTHALTQPVVMPSTASVGRQLADADV